MTDQTQLLIDILDRIVERIDDEEDYLTDLDSEVGDADFGVNVRRGLGAARDEATSGDFDGPDELLNSIGQTIISEMAGSSGILIGKSLMEGSEAFEDGIDFESAVRFAERYRDNVADQGNVDLGAKTMFDAIQPTVYALKRGLELDDVTPAEASAQSVKACQYGAQFTIPLRAKKGRASYTEWRSVGHLDPGAVSVLMVLQEIHAVVQDVHDEDVVPHFPGDLEAVLSQE